MQLLSTKPLTVHQVWSNGFKLAHQCLSSLYILFIVNELIALPLVLLSGGSKGAVSEAMNGHPVTFTLYMIVTALITLFIYAVGYHYLGNLLREKRYTVKDSLQLMLKKLPLLIVGTILVALVTFVGFVLLIIPGIFIFVASIFYYPTIILDDMSLIAALQYIFKLVWGNWWRSFYIVMGPIFLVSIVGGLFTLIIFVIQPASPGLASISNYISYIFHIFFQAYISLLMISITVIQWYDLKLRQQSLTMINT